MCENTRLVVELAGILQGVGFRPTLARLAADARMGGSTRNQSGTVRLELIGPAREVDLFVERLPDALPPRARLDRMEEKSRERVPASDGPPVFEILESTSEDDTKISIPADLAMCPDCARELRDPSSRYYGYPFVTCTNCGPRYTVVDGMPYDRARTALKEFPLCPACMAEYTNPLDRRFHAESIACAECGPSLTALSASGDPIEGDPLTVARAALARGEIVAVKGLGGFLLAVDAFNEDALRTLRERKRRPGKPFAVMARDLGVAEGLCKVPEAMGEVMRSPSSPIAVLELKGEDRRSRALPAHLLTPGVATLGVMLPTTPLHSLLAMPVADDGNPVFDLLVMTSGNRGGEPICITNDEALARLAGIPDVFLVHDRGINLRNDDSLVAFNGGAPQVWRRARGYAPDTVRLARPLSRNVLALGAELKNTVALAGGDEVVISPHIGDLETPEALDGLEEVVARFPGFFATEPDVVAVDLHPDMHSTRLGRRFAAEKNIQVREIQHHHAHAAAVMAEHGLDEAVALVFDGTGLGTDGAIWGAEAMYVSPDGFVRHGTFSGAHLPGGDQSVRFPVRQLAARWLATGEPISSRVLTRYGLREDALAIWRTQCEQGLNAPVSHAAGRLFDSFAAALGICREGVSYEGEAAILLEAEALKVVTLAGEPVRVPFSRFEEDGLLIIDWQEAFSRFLDQPPEQSDTPRWALAFHMAVADAAVEMAEVAAERSGCRAVVLSGGVMMNRVLFCELVSRLKKLGFGLFLPRQVPPNDGGVSTGQALIAGG